MKYCVMHNLRFETPAKRDKLDDDIKLKIKDKPVWGETIISKGEDKDMTVSEIVGCLEFIKMDIMGRASLAVERDK